MFCIPFFDFDGQPETIDPDGDEGEKYPLDDVPEKLNALSREFQPPPLHDGVMDMPSLPITNHPRQPQCQSDDKQKQACEIHADVIQHAAVEVRFSLGYGRNGNGYRLADALVLLRGGGC